MSRARVRIRIQRSRRLRDEQRCGERNAILPLDPRDPDVTKAKALYRRG